MLPIVRLYATEQAAQATVTKLVENYIPRDTISLIKPPARPKAERKADDEEGAPPPAPAKAPAPVSTDAVDAAIRDGVLPANNRKAAINGLRAGRTVVCVTPPYGKSKMAEDILNVDAVDTETLPSGMSSSNAAPFSETMGWPVLTEGKSHLELASSNWTFSSMFGMPLLTKSGRPTFDIKLGEHKRAAGTPVQTMSGDPAPFSSKIGMKLLSSGNPRQSAASSVRRMSGNPAPFSGFLGIKTLSKRK